MNKVIDRIISHGRGDLFGFPEKHRGSASSSTVFPDKDMFDPQTGFVDPAHDITDEIAVFFHHKYRKTGFQKLQDLFFSLIDMRLRLDTLKGLQLHSEPSDQRRNPVCIFNTCLD